MSSVFTAATDSVGIFVLRILFESDYVQMQQCTVVFETKKQISER